MHKKITLPLSGAILILLLVSNIYFYNISSWQWYSYTTRDGGFVFDAYPAKGRDQEMMIRNWEIYKTNEHPSDTIIYRTFPKNYFLAWKWLSYTRAQYDFPYIPDDRPGS